jgi:hypothetical protein
MVLSAACIGTHSNGTWISQNRKKTSISIVSAVHLNTDRDKLSNYGQEHTRIERSALDSVVCVHRIRKEAGDVRYYVIV